MRLRHLVVGRPLGNLGHLRLRRQTAAGAVALWTTAAAAVGSSMAAGHCVVDAGVPSGRRLNGSWALASPTPAMAVGSWTPAAAVRSSTAAGHLLRRRRRYQWTAAQRQLGTCVPDAGYGSWFVDGGWALVLGAGCGSWCVVGG
jgi:hypothetical protein